MATTAVFYYFLFLFLNPFLYFYILPNVTTMKHVLFTLLCSLIVTFSTAQTILWASQAGSQVTVEYSNGERSTMNRSSTLVGYSGQILVFQHGNITDIFDASLERIVNSNAIDGTIVNVDNYTIVTDVSSTKACRYLVRPTQRYNKLQRLGCFSK